MRKLIALLLILILLLVGLIIPDFEFMDADDAKKVKNSSAVHIPLKK